MQAPEVPSCGYVRTRSELEEVEERSGSNMEIDRPLAILEVGIAQERKRRCVDMLQPASASVGPELIPSADPSIFVDRVKSKRSQKSPKGARKVESVKGPKKIPSNMVVFTKSPQELETFSTIKPTSPPEEQSSLNNGARVFFSSNDGSSAMGGRVQTESPPYLHSLDPWSIDGDDDWCRWWEGGGEVMMIDGGAVGFLENMVDLHGVLGSGLLREDGNSARAR
ncbi:hypothetical protein M0R45_008764 [Rubus argutus]|uniref:Uncharacterized protein n=1 Tax=Rubus argutus TaxID=59490 RepID=A0AAW1Y338_RUBAR